MSLGAARELGHPRPLADAVGATGAGRSFFRVPAASERVPEWHVAPAVDMAAYHFSWVWFLAPFVWLGDSHWFTLFVVVMTANFVHRHFTLPYVYLDRRVFARHPWRFSVVPLVLIAAFVATPAVVRGEIPAGLAFGLPSAPVPGTLVMAAVAFAAGVWNFWHVQMQKFGILRLYDAKARALGSSGVPRWVDRLFLLGWLPFLVLYLGTVYRDVALERLGEAGPVLAATLDAIGRAQVVLWPLCIGLLAAGNAIFFYREWRANRFRSRPRLSMGIGMVALSSSFLIFDPVKVYMAYAFSHAVEYVVFVWAFQRRYYAGAPEPRPLLGRLLEHPRIAYAVFGGGMIVSFLALRDWGDHNVWGPPTWELGGATVGLWVFYWSVYQSFIHFYFDGFLWKTRRPDYRAAL